VSSRRRGGIAFSPGAAGPLLDEREDEREDWQDSALCAQSDPDAWYPELGGDLTAPKAICQRCPVRVACLDMALANDEQFGIWGGMAFNERRAERARRAARPVAAPAAAVASRPVPVPSLPELTSAEITQFRALTRAGACGITWAGRVTGDGAGVFEVRRGAGLVPLAAHRVAYQLLTGRDPRTDDPWQRCGNPACCTPHCLAPTSVNLASSMRLAA
jgi:WhiB family redox-sensing transcriptional regulator